MVFIISGKAAEKPLKEPKVIMYSTVISQVCFSLKMSSWSLKEVFTGTLFSQSPAAIAMMTRKGMYQNTAFCSQTGFVTAPFVKVCEEPVAAAREATVMIHGVTNWVRLTPKLPMPAWMPRAVPCKRFGKKSEVEGMKEEKSPPPMPVKRASTMKTQNGVEGSKIG